MYVRPHRQRMNFIVSKRLSRRKSLLSSITVGLRMSTRKPVMSATLSGGIVTSMEVTHWRGSDPGSAWHKEKSFTNVGSWSQLCENPNFYCQEIHKLLIVWLEDHFIDICCHQLLKYQKFERKLFYIFISESFISKSLIEF